MNCHSKAARTASIESGGSHRATSLALVSLVALLALVFVPSASALSQRPFKETFGSAAQPNLTFSTAIAVDKGTGDVLIADSSDQTISRFHADGTPAPFTALGGNAIDGKEANGKPCAEEPASCDKTPQDQLEINDVRNTQIAIDESGGPTDGDIYVTQLSSRLVYIFAADGRYLGQLTEAGPVKFAQSVSGVAVDSTGAVFVSVGSKIAKFSPTANPPVNTDYVSAIELGGGHAADNLAIGTGSSAGSLFAVGIAIGRQSFEVFDLATGELTDSIIGAYGTTVAVDPNTGTALVLKDGNGNEVGEFEAPDGSLVRISRLVDNQGIGGFAVNGSSEVLLTGGNFFTPTLVYGPPAIVPVVTADPASNVIGTKATLSGTVNPTGLPVTECYFEYGETGSSESKKAPCEGSIPTDSSPHPVQAILSSLEPNGHTYRFRLVAVNSNGFEETEGQTFVTAETVVAEPATALGPNKATLNGTLRPEGDQYTACFFEYGLSTSTSFEKTVPCEPSAATIAPDFSPHAVKASIAGLQSGSTYRYRLVATNSTGTIKTEEVTLNTLGTPRIGEIRASSADQGAVTLEATINPRGFGTSYRFEWGSTTAYGHLAPAEFEPFIGSGAEPVLVKSRISGLTASSLYHYRVVASSSLGVVKSPDHVAETLNSCGLIEGRCFELVSRREAGPVAIPGEANAHIEMHYQAATDGQGGLAYPVESGYPEATKGADVLYRSTRGPDSWESTQLSPPILAPNERSGVESVSSSVKWMSDDLSCGFVESTQPLTADPSMRLVREDGGSNLYRINPDGSYTGVSKLAPENSKGNLGGFNYDVAFASQDCSKVVFSSLLTYPGIPGKGDSRLYEWDEGTLHNAGVVPGPSGEVVVEAIAGGTSPFSIRNTQNTVSEDGSRAFFTATRQTSPNPAEVGSQAIFVRENGTVTRDLSLSQTATPAGNALFQWAAADGSRVFFTANAGLTDESNSEGIDLYEYDLETEELTDRSVTPAEGGAEVAGFVGADPEGTSVYFASRNQLIPGSGNSRAQNVKAHSYSIYGESGGKVDFVGTFGEDELSKVTSAGQGMWVSQVSPDGRYLLFESSSNLTGYDPGNGLSEAYLYDAKSGSSGTICISCRQDGQPSLGTPPRNDFGLPGYEVLSRSVFTISNPLHSPRFLTMHDGEPQVFFSSPDPLAPGAVEGQNNVYEWAHGQVFRLVSAQKDAQEHPFAGTYAVFAGASEDASDVYLVSPETLTWEDGDERPSAYDARVGGGYPQPAEPPSPCNPNAEGSCQGTAQGAPAVPGAASTTFNGPGNPPEQSTKKKSKKKPHKKKHVKKKKGNGRKARHANGNGRTGK